MSIDDNTIDQRHLDAIANADHVPYWLDGAHAPDTNATLVRTESCDLCVIGGGYTGLWTAIIAKERDASRDIVLIDSGPVGGAASGRNGGFMDASLTHGISNGFRHFPDDIEVLEELGMKNLDDIELALQRYGIECDYQRNGVIEVVAEHHPSSYETDLHEEFDLLRRLGHEVDWLDQEQMRAAVNSPTFKGGLWDKNGSALVDPARLVWGLKSVAERLGVRIYEDTKATNLERDGVGVLVTTQLGQIRAGRVALATNAFKPLLRRISNYIAPVYDYCMTTEPLTDDQLASIGWAGRQGLSDNANQFHYYRLTSDNRILWGGYDAIYYWRGRVSSELESRPSHGRSSAPTSSKRSRNSRTCSSATCGAEPSTPQAVSPSSGAARWAGVLATHLAIPASVSPQHASEPPPCSICCMGVAHLPHKHPWQKKNHGRSHPSHLGSWVFKQLVGRSNEKTKPVGATCG